MKMLSGDLLPEDAYEGVLVGRLWLDGERAGPRTVIARKEGLYDLSSLAPTISDVLDLEQPAVRVRAHEGVRLASVAAAVRNHTLLAPCDLQAIKASGVTFADSLIERVLEEQARGDSRAAQELRGRLVMAFGGSLHGVQPGSAQADVARELLMRDRLWSQYLEVGLGPDAEIFTKAQPLSSIGYGASIGLPPHSRWSSPEPEIVLAVSSRGAIVGATLGNDFTLRDFEGRSALLLGRAKDNNASCAIGPFIRLFESGYSLEDVRRADVHLRVTGLDGFSTAGVNSMAQISRDPVDLVAAAMGRDHQYPDGLMLFLGTMLVPNADRHGPGLGFTHEIGDVVSVSSALLGTLMNDVVALDQAPPWTFGVRALMASLAARGLL